jgi:hypothetical protein
MLYENTQIRMEGVIIVSQTIKSTINQPCNQSNDQSISLQSIIWPIHEATKQSIRSFASNQQSSAVRSLHNNSMKDGFFATIPNLSHLSILSHQCSIQSPTINWTRNLLVNLIINQPAIAWFSLLSSSAQQWNYQQSIGPTINQPPKNPWSMCQSKNANRSVT